MPKFQNSFPFHADCSYSENEHHNGHHSALHPNSIAKDSPKRRLSANKGNKGKFLLSTESYSAKAKKMNGIHNLADFQLPNGGLFASSVPNLKINEVNLNAMAALLASSSDGCQSMLNGLEDAGGALGLFGAQSHQNPFYSYLNQNLFASGLKAAGGQEMTPAMVLQNAGLSNGILNGFDKIDSLNSLFKPTNGNMLGRCFCWLLLDCFRPS